MSRPTRENLIASGYLWLDMEFTGLDVDNDLILEVGAIATSGLFEIQGEFSCFIHHEASELVPKLESNSWWGERPEHKEAMLNASLASGLGISDVEQQLDEFAKQYVPTGEIFLAGNSVYTDRRWIERYMPKFFERLNYRMLDVSGFKLVVSSLVGTEFIKNERHRALEDIEESMLELKFLLETLGQK